MFEFGNAMIKAYTTDEAMTKQIIEGPSQTQKAVGWMIIAGCIAYYVLSKKRRTEHASSE